MTARPASALAEPGSEAGVVPFFFNAAGRMGRAAFTAGAGVVVATLLLYQSLATGWLRSASAWLIYLLLFTAGGVILSKRLHDRGRAGWWAAPVLLAFLLVWPYPHGWRALAAPVLLIAAIDLAVLPGERRFNRFGPEPRRN